MHQDPLLVSHFCWIITVNYHHIFWEAFIMYFAEKYRCNHVSLLLCWLTEVNYHHIFLEVFIRYNYIFIFLYSRVFAYISYLTYNTWSDVTYCWHQVHRLHLEQFCFEIARPGIIASGILLPWLSCIHHVDVISRKSPRDITPSLLTVLRVQTRPGRTWWSQRNYSQFACTVWCPDTRAPFY